MEAEITEVRYKIRSSISKDPDCYDYEEIEVAACPAGGTSLEDLIGELKLTAWKQCTLEPGTAKDKKPAYAGKRSGGGSQSAPVDWSSMYAKYNIPYKAPAGVKWSTEQVRKYLKEAGAKFRGKRDDPVNGDNCWYVPQPIENDGFIAQYKTILNQSESGEDITDEDLPF